MSVCGPPKLRPYRSSPPPHGSLIRPNGPWLKPCSAYLPAARGWARRGRPVRTGGADRYTALVHRLQLDPASPGHEMTKKLAD